MKGEKGLALVITLIITALLVALCVQFVSEVFVDTSAARSFSDGQRASLLADSGMDAAIRLLQYGRSMNPGYTSQGDLDRLAGLLNMEDEAGVLRVTVEDESGRLNLNLAWGENGAPLPPRSEIARRLVRKSGFSPDLLDALADWIDVNGDPLPGGADTAYYGKLTPPCEVKNGRLSTVEELRLVKGFDVAFDRLRPFVTVYDVCGQVNINTAPWEVIAALSDEMTESLAKGVVDYRKNHPFRSVNDLMNVPGISGRTVQALQGFISVRSAAFRIHSEAKVNETVRIVEAVADTGGQVLYWREY